jgi:nucleoside phosphorylase
MMKVVVPLAVGGGAAIAWWLARRTQQRRVVVCCAVQEEARFVEAALQNTFELPLQSLNRRRVRGWLGSLLVDVITCGIGEVDAAMAMTAALLADTPRPIAVLSVGCAGSHCESVMQGDVVLATSVVPTACCMVRPDGTSEHVGLRLTTADVPVRELYADAGLLRLASAAGRCTALPPWPTQLLPKVHEGKLGSSDTWTQHHGTLRRWNRDLGTLCEEMEAYAVGRVCMAFNVPFLAIKDIANNELHAEIGALTETGRGESIILSEIGRRAAAIAVGTMRLLAGVTIL